MKKIYIAIVALTLSGCAPQEALKKTTPSGKPEGDFPGKTIEDVSGAIVGFCNNNGYQVQEVSEKTVTCGKVMDGSNSVITQMMIGNSYSTPPESKVRFSFVKTSTGVHAWADMWAETQMVGGQVNRIPITDNKSRNFIQWAFDN